MINKINISENTSEWNITTDVYSIVDSLNKLKARYIDDVNETTLSLGIFGFIGDTEAKKIQSSIIMTGELGNEMFPARAKLNKNILAHAVYCNVEGINAIPATLTVNIGIKESDLDKYMNNNEFIFDSKNSIFIRDKEFHLDYDIILKRFMHQNNFTVGSYWVYSAEYDMDNHNDISTIVNPHIDQPMRAKFGNDIYIFFTVTVHQVAIEENSDTLITDSIINNKSYTFKFSNQLANFEVYVIDGDGTTRLTPLFYGAPVEAGVERYCWYMYINDNTVRIEFDSNSFTPGLNSQIQILARTTLGKEGNFTYVDIEENDVYCDFVSKYSNNKKLTCLVRCATPSENGADRKTIDELKALIPKMAMSRGYITTETDLNNYFNLISNEDNIIQLQKKVDNQLNRIWYAYYVLKDELNNVIPANTINIKINPFDSDGGHVIPVQHQSGGIRYLLPAGTVIRYNPNTGKEPDPDEPIIYDPVVRYGYGVPINEDNFVPYSNNYFSNESYYYRTIHDILLSTEQTLYASKFLSIVNYYSYFNYYFTNKLAPIGLSTIQNHFYRNYMSDTNKYNFTFTAIQSVDEDFGFIPLDDSGAIIQSQVKLKCFIVIIQNNEPYRYKECTIESYSIGSNVNFADGSDWKVTFDCTSQDLNLDYDSDNRILLTNLCEIQHMNESPGYFQNNCEAYLYVAAKLDNPEQYKDGDPDRLLYQIIPEENYEGYTLLDIYKVEGGLNFYYNFSDVMNTKIVQNQTPDDPDNHTFDIYGIPVVGYHYFNKENEESDVSYLVNQLINKKNYIDYCLRLVENNMGIDFKFFNTYGYSWTYTIGDKEQTSINHVDLTSRFRLKLSQTADSETRDAVILYIKNYFENLNRTKEIHIPNLLHDVKEEFGDAIIYIEFMNYNDFRLGINHIELRYIDDPHIVPEFINVRNRLLPDGVTLAPDIDIELVN